MASGPKNVSSLVQSYQSRESENRPDVGVVVLFVLLIFHATLFATEGKPMSRQQKYKKASYTQECA